MSAPPIIAAVDAPEAVVGYLAAASVEVKVVDSTARSPEAMAVDLRDSYGSSLVGVAAVSDDSLLYAAALAAALDTPGASKAAVASAADKVAMRRRMAEAGMPQIRFANVSSAAEVKALVAQVGRVIVKPATGSGSRRIMVVEDVQDPELDRFSSVIGDESSWICEEYLRGPEISVETLSWAGRHTVLAMTGKETGAGFIELSHRVPLSLPAGLAAEVEQLVIATLTALGMDFTVGHTEVILTATGPRVVETHPRLGGDRIGRLVELVTGHHPLTMLAAAMAGTDPTPLPGSPAAAIRFMTAPPGLVVALDGADSASGMPGVVEVSVSTQVGALVEPLRSSSDRCGYVIATGGTTDEAAQRALRAAEQVRLVVEPVTTPVQDPELVPAPLQ